VKALEFLSVKEKKKKNLCVSITVLVIGYTYMMGLAGEIGRALFSCLTWGWRGQA